MHLPGATSLAIFLSLGITQGQPLLLPTANDALYTPGLEAEFFVGTPGRTWESGTFGCVRTDGWQIHEGLDIRALERDKRGEPTDPVLATAAGEVVHANSKAALSNYGKYVVLRHHIDGIEVYSLYAHLSAIEDGVRPGTVLQAGQRLGIMGRTANTRSRISKERAHVHFELALMLNDRFPEWYKKRYPTQRNDHGKWSGLNLVAMDPAEVFLQQHNSPDSFSLANYLHSQTEMFRVWVRDPNLQFARRYQQLIRQNPRAEQLGTVGYDVAFNYNGLPFALIPRSAAEVTNRNDRQVLWVNEPVQKAYPCRKLITKTSGEWRLTSRGARLIELLTF